MLKAYSEKERFLIIWTIVGEGITFEESREATATLHFVPPMSNVMFDRYYIWSISNLSFVSKVLEKSYPVVWTLT